MSLHPASCAAAFLVASSLVLACSSAPPDESVDAVGSSATAPPLHPELRGLLASPVFDGQPMKGMYFFPGESGANACLYTAHPVLAEDRSWNSDPSIRGSVIDRIAATHANTIVLSYWGDMARWSPMALDGTSVPGVLDAIAGKPIVVMPSLESGVSRDPRDTGPSFDFKSDFPFVFGVLAPKLLARIDELAALFHGRMSEWAQLYDRTGAPRYAIHLLHVHSDQPEAADPRAFAAAFDAVANAVWAKYGFAVGFTLDIVPNGARYVATPWATGAALEGTASVLAIQGFASEVWSMRASGGCPDRMAAEANDICALPTTCPAPLENDPAALAAVKRSMRDQWVATGLPVFLDVSPGFDGRYVWMDQGAGYWGDSLKKTDDRWRNSLSVLKGGGVRGITFNTWNGYTEGYAATPTYEHWVTAREWVTDLYSADPRVCDHMHYANGSRSHHVYGAICDKWMQLDQYDGMLSAPQSDEGPTPGGTGRILHFTDGAILWSAATGAHAVHGIIGATYAGIGFDQSCLGLPIADEEPNGNGRIARFQRGEITWSPGDTQGHVTCRRPGVIRVHT